MNKTGVRKYLRLAIIIVFSMIVGSAITIFIKDDRTFGKVISYKGITRSRSEFNSLYETYDTIMKEYYKDVDSDKLIESAIEGMLSSLEDEHTMLFNEKEKEDFDTELSGTYYGIGAQIQETEEETVKIIKIFDGSPAESAGLKVGDVFVSIDGKSTEGMNASDIANTLRSDKVKKSKIVVNRDGEEIEISVTKANVTLFSVDSEMIDDNIGYIGVSIFGEKTYSQFVDSIEKLEKENMKSLIIDLRGNTGGYLSTVTDMLELFIDKGNVLYKMQTNDGIVEYKSKRKATKDYKVVILIDESSASASEIMAAAMKEDYKATLVGKTTYGKGTVQVTKNLSNGYMLKYTIENWLTPSGEWIDKKGIEPDYDVSLSEEYNNDPTRENDSQLQKAIELLK